MIVRPCSKASSDLWDKVTDGLMRRKTGAPDAPSNVQLKELIEEYGNQRFYDGQEDGILNP